MGAVCYASSHLLRGWLGIGKVARLADLGVSIPLGVAVFYAAARALRIAELEMAGAALPFPLARRLRPVRAKMN